MRKITFLNTKWLGSSSLSIIIYTCPVPENTFYNIMKEQATTKVQSLPLIVLRRLDGGRVQSWFSQPNAYSTLATTSSFPILHGNLLPPPQTAPKHWKFITNDENDAKNRHFARNCGECNKCNKNMVPLLLLYT